MRIEWFPHDPDNLFDLVVLLFGIGIFALSIAALVTEFSERNDMFTKKDHNIRVVLRETLSNTMDEEDAIKVADAIEDDVFREIRENGEHPDKFSGDEVGRAVGRILRRKFCENNEQE